MWIEYFPLYFIIDYCLSGDQFVPECLGLYQFQHWKCRVLGTPPTPPLQSQANQDSWSLCSNNVWVFYPASGCLTEVISASHSSADHPSGKSKRVILSTNNNFVISSKWFLSFLSLWPLCTGQRLQNMEKQKRQWTSFSCTWLCWEYF